VEATNLFVVCPFFFAGEYVTAVFMSTPVAVVLPEEGISASLASSSGESWGERNRAVGRGPFVEGPLDFFKIGCVGGGFDALDERLRNPFSLAMSSCLCELEAICAFLDPLSSAEFDWCISDGTTGGIYEMSEHS
jgi:hypothetical protein